VLREFSGIAAELGEGGMTETESDAGARLLRALDAAATRIEELERQQAEPIAIIGMACRFPGCADDPQAFWRLLVDGVDAVGELPDDRFDLDACFDPDPDRPGCTYVRVGGFLRDIDRFDAEFFAVSPREAENLDPQQRILLETAWEAFEDAGLPRAGLIGSRTGVFVGLTACDYGSRLAHTLDRVDAHHATGNMLNMAAGRLSFFFGLRGPSVAVDTACSSSLVATHYACQSLRTRECDAALAAGVNVIVAPDGFVALSKARVLARDGRCKPFDRSADGMARGEGCGVLVLKRYSDALAAGDRILALIRGSAVNHDGASAGLTVPNGPAQQELIRSALARARLDPLDIDYVEAHGTGTALGDPIELEALGKVFGPGRSPSRPLLVGSVKANIAHLEPAAGMAALIKTVLCLRQRRIPPQLHFADPSTHINWERLPIRVPMTATSWPADGKPRYAGVSGFGFSGTNAHVVVEEGPEEATAEPSEATAAGRARVHLLPISAASAAALDDLALRYARSLRAATAFPFADVCRAAGRFRDHHAYRAGIVATSREEAATLLERHARGEETPFVRLGQARAASGLKIAFLFSGQGTQYAGMGGRLYDREPVFRAAIDKCSAVAGRNLLSSSEAEIADEHNAQPALFALEYALAVLLKAWGVVPDAVLGHGLGEYAAACVAGVFDVDAAVRLVCERACLVGSLPRDGAMVSVGARFLECLSTVDFRRPAVSLVSSVTGRIADGEVTRAGYWVDHLLQPVMFGRGVAVLHAANHRVFVEIAPHSTLIPIARAAAPHHDAEWLPTLERGRSDDERMMVAAASLYARGVSLDWAGLHGGGPTRRVPLPTYPFQRRSYWFRPGSSPSADAGVPLFGVEWTERPSGAARGHQRRWLVVGEPEHTVRLYRRLLERGDPVALVDPAASTHDRDIADVLNRPDPRPLAIVRVASANGTACATQTSPADAVQRDCVSVLALVRRAAATGRIPGDIRLWLLTFGAQPVSPPQAGPHPVSVHQASLWGLGRVIALEHPDLWGGLIDLDPSVPTDPSSVIAEIESNAEDDQVAYRRGRRFVPRLRPRLVGAAPPIELGPGASYLVTGAAGALGLATAEWLVERGARHLVLAGRHEPDAAGAVRIERMRRLGARVVFECADVGERCDVARLIRIADRLAPLRGIVHAAGVLADGLLVNQDDRMLAAAMRGKALGALHLDAETRGRALDWFFMFSSATSVFGASGQGGYAAANAVLDAVAADRRSRGEPAIAIGWGPWRGAGMAARLDPQTHARLSHRGLVFVTAKEGLRTLDRLFACDSAHVIAARFDAATLRRAIRLDGATVLDGLVPADATPRDLTDVDAVLRDRHRLVDHLRVRLRAIVRLGDDQELAADSSLQDHGIDSIMATEFRNRLLRDFRIDVPIATFLSSATLDAVADAILREVALGGRLTTSTGDEVEEVVL
jgi:acyl transferase domain-containing protein